MALKRELLIPGRLARSKGHPAVNPLEKDICTPVDLINLTVGDTTIDLSKHAVAVGRFHERLDTAVERLNQR